MSFHVKCETSAKRKTRGGGKIKRLFPVHCSGSSTHLRSEVLTDQCSP